MSWYPQLGSSNIARPDETTSFYAPAVSSIRPQYIVTTPSRSAVDCFGAPPAYGQTVPYLLEPWGMGTDAALGAMVGFSMAAMIYAASMGGLYGYGYGLPLYGFRW